MFVRLRSGRKHHCGVSRRIGLGEHVGSEHDASRRARLTPLSPVSAEGRHRGAEADEPSASRSQRHRIRRFSRADCETAPDHRAGRYADRHEFSAAEAAARPRRRRAKSKIEKAANRRREAGEANRGAAGAPARTDVLERKREPPSPSSAADAGSAHACIVHIKTHRELVALSDTSVSVLSSAVGPGRRTSCRSSFARPRHALGRAPARVAPHARSAHPHGARACRPRAAPHTVAPRRPPLTAPRSRRAPGTTRWLRRRDPRKRAPQGLRRAFFARMTRGRGRYPA